MAYISGALKDTLLDLGWKQTDLAEKCGLPASQINRYLRGKFVQMPMPSVQAILAVLPEDKRGRIVVAYLRDCLPEDSASLVRIEPVENRVHEDLHPANLIIGTDRELDRMLRIYADLAMRHPEVRDMLRSFLDAIGALRDRDGS